MFKKLVILFLIVAPMGVYAQDKLAYINTQEVFTQMPEIKDVETKLSAKQDEIQKNLTAIQAEYDKKMEEFKVSTAEVTESLLMDRQKQIQQIQERYETYHDNSEKEFQDLRQQLLTPIQQKLQQAIKTVGDKHGFTYIIEIGAVPYASTSAVDAGRLVKAELGIK